jgi:hydroxymethylpyrimidine pyrophosphatase-like HAD family hydrolase
MNRDEDKLIRAIFSDYDGTLCPASATRDTRLGQNRIPLEIKKVLQEIAEQIPVCIISSKDYFFLKETRAFAKVISCLMGIETLIFPSDTTAAAITVDREQQQQSPPISRKLLVDKEEESENLTTRSDALEDIAKGIESKPDFRSVMVERKYTYDRRILAGLTVDWRYSDNWDYYKKGVRHFISALVTNLSKPPVPIHLYVQKYDFHPFVDVYIEECNKGTAFDLVLSEISPTTGAYDIGEKNEDDRENSNNISNSIRAEDVLYLGDSENDNHAFRKAGVSIGVRSHSGITPKLDCQHTTNFDRLARFLRQLKESHLKFSEEQLIS